ncbi:cell wall hydrolase [Oceanomicrobium pacificus]|uniref:Cell wall hydrolase n=1 Tax=Oceanomicrobium pacificus TaxID=2692916 RepID=A0A6B0TZD1_9RHOB|nr:cell wall hydrolase [Oceanomicrobium pacificus]MXU66768.1 cell wall hydrolase [Oceanomicrobium pacificus]
MILSNCTTAPAEAPEATRAAGDFSAKDVACLSEAMYFEAAAFSVKGQQAVGEVIVNRKNDPRFPNTICGVISEGVGSGRGCQFSYKCDGNPEHYRYKKVKAQTDQTAKAVLSGKTSELAPGALFFHSARIAPGWFASRPRIGTFGGNIFYK